MLEDEADDIFCPFCQFKSRKSEEVQLHIWSTHEERLKTPTKSISYIFVRPHWYCCYSVISVDLTWKALMVILYL